MPRWSQVATVVALLLLAAEAAPAAEIFAWFGEGGVMTLRSSASHGVLGRISPGLYGPGWTGFEMRAQEGSSKQVAADRWQYGGTLIPEGRQGAVDYSLTAKSTASGVELTYEFKTRAEIKLNALYLRFGVPISFATGGRAYLPGKEIVLPASYQGNPGLYYGAGKAVEFHLASEEVKLSLTRDAEIELQDDREWKDDTFDLSFHFFHSDQPRFVPAGTVFKQTLLVEVEGMKKPIFEPTIKSKTDTSGWFPFDMPPDVPREGEAGFEGAVDFSGSIEKPAGKHGFLKANGEHFAFEDGTPIKFWGVNLDSGGGLPEKAHAPTAARRMAQLGINIARFTVDHAAPKGIIAEGNDTRHTDTAMLDRLDYFVACLKENGVYVRLDLMHYRTYKPGDGVDAPEREGDEGVYGGGPAMYFDPKAEELHKEFSRQLLLHENPYTKLRYVDDPAMVFVGIVNENSIFFYPRRMTESGRKKLDGMYEEWVETHPGGTKTRFLAEVERRYYGRMYAFLHEIGVKTPIACHNMVMNAADGQLMAQVGDHMEFNTYWDHPHKDYHWVWNKPMVKDRGGIFPTMAAASAAGKPFAITEINFCDMLYRMEGPLFTLAYASLQDWDAVLWWEYNAAWDRAGGFEDFPGTTSMFTTRDNPMILAQFGAASVAFREGYVSPAKTRANVKLTDEDVFAEPNWIWEHSWSGLSPGSPFAALPLMLQIRSQYGEKVSGRRPDLVLESGASGGGSSAPGGTRVSFPKPAETAEKDPDTVWRAVRRVLDEQKLAKLPEPGATTFPSDTGELNWDTAKGAFTINSPRFQAAVGFLAGERFRLADFTIDLADKGAVGSTSAKVAAISLCPLDGRPLKESSRILLTVTGRAEDTGQIWEEGSEGDIAADSGERPVLAEPVRGQLVWSGRKLRIFALSASGNRAKEIALKKQGSLAFGGDQTMWYELVPADTPDSAEESLHAY